MARPVVVQKYGGSSVADLDKIRVVADRIAATVHEGHGVVAVVSAMGNTTNELIALARQAATSPDRRELDMLVSVGERVTMSLLAMCLRDRGVAARSLTGSQSGIITDEQHADARVVAVRPDRLRQTLDAGEVAIVAGFQGVSRHREVTTLGRGGSDTTAVVLAAALGAQWAEICSDVDGVWSADPRVVTDAHKLEALSLDAGLELARGGAKVLFEDAVRYARDHGVEIRAAATFGPGSGTRLTVDATSSTGASAVTGDAQLAAVRVSPTDADTLRCIVEAGGRVRRRVGEVVHVDMRNAHGGLDEALSAEPIAVATAVGSGLGEQALRLAEASAALLAAGIPASAHGSQGDAAWWQVAVGRLDEAVQVLHGALVTVDE
jgi:aspartate kinase